MHTYQTIITVVYALLLFSYFFVETRKELFPYRVAIKIVLASTYLILSVVNTLLTGNEYTIFKILVCVAAFFAWFGDTFLLFKKMERVGVLSFLIANIMLIISEMNLIANTSLTFGEVWWAILIVVGLYGALLFLQFIKFVDFGKETIPLNVYIFTMTVTGSIGLTLAFSNISTLLWLFGLGVAFFMVSDYCLGAYLYKGRPKTMLVLNSASYFTGMLLIALSLGF